MTQIKNIKYFFISLASDTNDIDEDELEYFYQKIKKLHKTLTLKTEEEIEWFDVGFGTIRNPLLFIKFL